MLHIFLPNLFLLLYFQSWWIYPSTWSLKPEAWELYLSPSFPIPSAHMQCITKSPSLQVTIISHQIITERAMFLTCAAVFILAPIHSVLYSQSEFSKMPVSLCFSGAWNLSVTGSFFLLKLSLRFFMKPQSPFIIWVASFFYTHWVPFLEKDNFFPFWSFLHSVSSAGNVLFSFG